LLVPESRFRIVSTLPFKIEVPEVYFFPEKSRRKKRSLQSARECESLEFRQLLTTLPTGFTEVQMAELSANPMALVTTPDGRVLIATDNDAGTGSIDVIKDGVLLPTPALQFPIFSPGEFGINGMTIDPDFAQNNFVYIYYTTTQGGRHNRLSRFTFDGDVVVPGSEFVVMDFDLLGPGIIHNGGGMGFGHDGKLYVAIGDNVQPEKAQTLDNQHGKVLRLNSDGTIPTDNPFYHVTTGNNRAIYALGVRSPFTMDVDPLSGRIFFTEVGSSLFEEFNELVEGGNYGWPIYEGYGNDPAYIDPLYAYPHGSGIHEGCAITGGTFYHPAVSQFPAQYEDKYFFIDFCNGWIDTYDLNTGVVEQFASGLVSQPIALHVDELGAMYYVSVDTGRVMKIEFPVDTPPAIAYQPQDAIVALGEPASFFVSVGGSAPISYQWKKDGIDIPGADTNRLTLGSTSIGENGAEFSVAISNSFGSIVSEVATLTVVAGDSPQPVITLPLAGDTYVAGDVIQFAGSATDTEDGVLPVTNLTWKVAFHHDSHHHPVLDSFSGASGGSFTVPTVGETSANTWFRIHLTAVDSTGLETHVFHDIYPETTYLTLTSTVPGIELTLDGSPVATPHTVEGVVGTLRAIGAATTQIVNGREYQFVGWSDGGDQGHTIATSASDTTYTAIFGAVDQLSPPVQTGPSNPTLLLRPTFTWNPVVGAISYDIWIRNATTLQNPYILTNVTSANYTPPANMEIGRFNVWLRSVGANGYVSDWSAPVNININTPVTLNSLPLVQTTPRPTISWAVLPGAVKYDLWLNNTATGQSEFVRDATLTSTSWAPSFDLPMAGYRVWVRGIDAEGVPRNWSAPMDFNVVPVPVLTGPPNPTLLIRPSFTWNPIVGAVSYDIWIRNATTLQNPYILTNVTSASYTPPSDMEIGRFNVWVRSRSPFGHVSAWSQPVNININTPVTLNPMPLAQETARPTVSWATLPGAVKYDLWIDNRSTGQSQFVRETELTTTSWTSPVDLPMGRYRFWVRGIDAEGVARNWSVFQDFIIVPSPVLVLPLDSTFNRTPVFQWTPVLGATQYEIRVRKGAATVLQSTVTTNSFTAPSALSDGTYFWRVNAILPTGPNGVAGVSSQFTAEARVNVGGQPALFGPTGTTSGLPVFLWSNVQGAVSYELRVGTTTENVNQASLILAAGLTSNTYTPSSPLSPGTYRYWVRAVSTSNENSIWSVTGTFTVVAVDAPADSDLVGPLTREPLALLAGLVTESEEPVRVVPRATLPAETADAQIQQAKVTEPDQVPRDWDLTVPQSLTTPMVQLAFNSAASDETFELSAIDQLMDQFGSGNDLSLL
jgi:glucose/arabinose dehydrogenase